MKKSLFDMLKGYTIEEMAEYLVRADGGMYSTSDGFVFNDKEDALDHQIYALEKEGEDDCEKFLVENKVSFDQMIRCFNFWSELSFNRREEYLKNYTAGDYDCIGHY